MLRAECLLEAFGALADAESEEQEARIYVGAFAVLEGVEILRAIAKGLSGG